MPKKSPARSPRQVALAGAPAKNPSVATLSDVVALFKASGLHELTFEDANVHVKLTLHAPSATVVHEAPRPLTSAAPVQPVAAPHPHVPAPHAPAVGGEEGHLVTSPFVGTFYRASSPGAPVFVQVGSTVKKGQTLCIIEAMKLMNEIESDENGTVAEIFVENAQPCEYGQKLFRIVPG